ncbi:hypothetical protein CLIB1444_07S07316 [[Candida] jaroonii]|uniref:Uncharacterized protein n=1 Tax=[Candida] jaroonii TaxID=467808 RepID=A0ACA9YC33_9ASCO|nr:hypothetical protein CLIB1444_07S07316 [[Candida] jaroonii]
MKLSYFIYALKVNIFQVIVEKSRSESLNLQYIHSSLFDATACQPTDENVADFSFVNNVTDCADDFVDVLI